MFAIPLKGPGPDSISLCPKKGEDGTMNLGEFSHIWMPEMLGD